MDRIYFQVNGDKYSVGSEIDSDVSLNDYLRNHLNLRGTKYMCKEGGCGACVVAVTVTDPGSGHRRTFSVNSCLTSITSCQDWDITTVEGIGGRHQGYHPVQKRLAKYNGTQCGYCSAGFVMSMYSLLESNNYSLSREQIEDSFGSNTCRCTGYRPILDAFKSFSRENNNIDDIEDLKICSKKNCKENCPKDWCIINKEDAEPRNVKIHLKDDRIWYRVHALSEVFDIIANEDDYMLVNGNTGKGAIPIFAYPHILIDISQILELKTNVLDQNLVIGAGTTLADLMKLFEKMSTEHAEFKYLAKLYEHLNLVAHIPVRNIGTIAGNLMLKHREPTFSSDIFLLFEAVGATLTIIDKHSYVEVTPEEFLHLDMNKKIIHNVKLPPLSSHYKFVSYKIMPRSQNAHASVNAAFLYKFLPNNETVESARLVFGGLSGKFVHARQTEQYLVGRDVFTDEVLHEALKILDSELVVEEIPGEFIPEYRKKCALGLFYKGLLSLAPLEKLNPQFHSGRTDLRKIRPVSKGTEVYDTNPLIWPMTEPMPKVEALGQCSGKVSYANDLPTMAKEVFCAFVTAKIGRGEFQTIDPSEALALPGVLTFISAKDIPGENTFLSRKTPFYNGPEEIFSSGQIKYYDQPIGLIVAETETLANRAASLVKITYKNVVKDPILSIRDVKSRDPGRLKVYMDNPARDRGSDIQKVIKGSSDIYWQYHFTMEPQQCVTKFEDELLDVHLSTQWVESAQNAISDALIIEQNKVNVTSTRCGGAYGCRISRSNWVGVVSALVVHLTGRPCRFALSIRATMRAVGKRLPVNAEYEIGVNNRGEIQYLNYNFYEDNGYVFTDQIIFYAAPSLKNCYNRERWSSTTYNVTTDTPSNSWARSPGSLEAISMTEIIMEQISYELNLDPLEVRQRNLKQDPALLDIIQTLVQDSQYYTRKDEIKKFNTLNRWKKKGLRVALMSWDVVLAVDYQVLLSVFHGDGTVLIQHGGVEIGQGVNTKVIQLVAYTLGIPKEKVKSKTGDVFTSPNNYSTGNSKTTEAIYFAAVKCCQLLLDRLAEINIARWEDRIEEAYNRGISVQTSYRTNANDHKRYQVAGGAVAEVELDILTGEHDVLRVDIVEDAGTSVNPELDVGQIEGSFIMGLGYWTCEHLIYDPSGELLTDRTWNYHVPLAKDIPVDFRVKLRKNSFNPESPVGSRAVGEPATCLSISVAFALHEAIAASKSDTGFPSTEWFNVDCPSIIRHCNIKKNREPCWTHQPDTRPTGGCNWYDAITFGPTAVGRTLHFGVQCFEVRCQNK